MYDDEVTDSALEKSRVERLQTDPDTEKLLAYLRTMSERYIEIAPGQEVEGRVFSAAISYGKETGQIEFAWIDIGAEVNESPGVELVEADNGEKKAVVKLNRDLFGKIEADAQKYLPGERLPEFVDKTPYILIALKNARKLEARIVGWDNLMKMMVEAYKIYQKI